MCKFINLLILYVQLYHIKDACFASITLLRNGTVKNCQLLVINQDENINKHTEKVQQPTGHGDFGL